MEVRNIHQERIHAILLGFHQNTETFQSANQKIEYMLDEAYASRRENGFDEAEDK